VKWTKASGATAVIIIAIVGAVVAVRPGRFRQPELRSPWRRPAAGAKNDPAVLQENIRRLESGNVGAAKALREGVFELRLDFGPGYRVYFGRDGKTIIILLGGGSKRRQDADITAANARWQRYQQAKKEK